MGRAIAPETPPLRYAIGVSGSIMGRAIAPETPPLRCTIGVSGSIMSYDFQKTTLECFTSGSTLETPYGQIKNARHPQSSFKVRLTKGAPKC